MTMQEKDAVTQGQALKVGWQVGNAVAACKSRGGRDGKCANDARRVAA